MKETIILKGSQKQDIKTVHEIIKTVCKHLSKKGCCHGKNFCGSCNENNCPVLK